MGKFLLTAMLCSAITLQAAPEQVVHGRAIYGSILQKYPGLTLYLESGLMGENARLVADVPTVRWRKMSASERRDFAAYVQSELATVRSNPSKYSLTPETAPIWPTHRAAFQRICDACWEIHVGHYDPSSGSLGDADWSVAVKGDARRERPQSHTMLHDSGLVPLSRTTATAGRKLYNAAGFQEATIVKVDLSADRIVVRYLKSGTVEPKILSAVSAFWYIKK